MNTVKTLYRVNMDDYFVAPAFFAFLLQKNTAVVHTLYGDSSPNDRYPDC